MSKRYSMDNPDPDRYRPPDTDWQWDGSGAVEEGCAVQLMTLTALEWQAIEKALIAADRADLAVGARDGAGSLRRCAMCDSSDVACYRVVSGTRIRTAYCNDCAQQREGGQNAGTQRRPGWRDADGWTIPRAGELAATLRSAPERGSQLEIELDGSTVEIVALTASVAGVVGQLAAEAPAPWRVAGRGSRLVLARIERDKCRRGRGRERGEQ